MLNLDYALPLVADIIISPPEREKYEVIKGRPWRNNCHKEDVCLLHKMIGDDKSSIFFTTFTKLEKVR